MCPIFEPQVHYCMHSGALDHGHKSCERGSMPYCHAYFHSVHIHLLVLINAILMPLNATLSIGSKLWKTANIIKPVTEEDFHLYSNRKPGYSTAAQKSPIDISNSDSDCGLPSFLARRRKRPAMEGNQTSTKKPRAERP